LGPFLIKFEEIASEEMKELAIWLLTNLRESRMPFQNVANREVGQSGKDFFCWIMNLDPRDRQRAIDILANEWWSLE
jgi:hypothetical protein